MPENLPRVEQRDCLRRAQLHACGGETSVIGYDESEAAGRRAGALVRAGDQARKTRVRKVLHDRDAAPLAPRIVEKGLASDAVVIDTVVAKYCDHLPLYRQAAMLEREAGVEIGRATLDGWVMRVGELLEPMVGAMRRDLLRRILFTGR